VDQAVSSQLLKKLEQAADLVASSSSNGKIMFKLNFDKMTQLSLSELKSLFAQAGFELSPGLQKAVLDRQGISRYAELFLRKGDLILKPVGFLDLSGIRSLVRYNAAERLFHARPMDFQAIHSFLENRGYPIVCHVQLDFSLPQDVKKALHLDLVLRDYQEEALRRWLGARGRGVVVLPTGAGKTVVALEAIRRMVLRTLIVVPTIDLLGQWREALERRLHVPEVGVLGGGVKTIAPVTVSTYDSASLMAPKLSDSFGLLVFDEVHHLPSPTYRLSAELMIAPHRLGLTATPERYDELHRDLDRLVGPIVYRIAPRLLEQEGYLAPYRIETVQIALTPEEQEMYEKHMAVFRSYARKLSRLDPDWRFETIVERTLFDPEARQALSHLEKARRIALEASGKIEYVEKLLSRYHDSKVIIFSRYTRIVERISDIFGIPLITHKTKAAERARILSSFREGVYTKLVTGQVLDEGVDVPDASVGIIISGTGSKREFIQRLGRLLRPKKEGAILIELVTESTLEDGISKRRRMEEQEENEEGRVGL